MFFAAISLAFGAAGALILGLRAAVSSEIPGEGPHSRGFL